MILSAISAIQPLPPLDDTTEHTEGEELGVNICCSSASALCQTGNNDGKSWNSPVVSLVTGLVARKSSCSKSCRPKPELNALLSLKKLSNTLHLGRKPFECQSCKSSFVFFLTILLCDWPRKPASLSQPIRFKIKTNCDPTHFLHLRAVFYFLL